MERKLRLVQVAREFKVGLATITEFLSKKGINDVSPNTLVEADTYALLEKEFGGNRLGGERDNIRERISHKPESVSLGDRKDAAADDFKEEVVIKSSVVGGRPEVSGPKVLGKINLDSKGNVVKPTEEPKKPKA